MRINTAFLTDGYKLLHHLMYPEGTGLVFDNMTPRGNKFATIKGAENVVVLVQYSIFDLVNMFNEDFFLTKEREGASPEQLIKLRNSVIEPIVFELSLYLGMPFDPYHFVKLWDLGYLPLEIRTLDEGTICPMRVPYLTVHNTHKDFYWLPNYIESILSQKVWFPVTSATTVRGFRILVNEWALKTTGSTNNTDFQLHDFSMRGLQGVDGTISSGIGHLTSSLGTDNIPSIIGVRYAYGDDGFIGGGVRATEHSIMSSEGQVGEFALYERLLKLFPSGLLSLVSDTYSLWTVYTEYLPKLKELIMSREGKLVIRPDSGNVVDIICGTVKAFYPDQDLEVLKHKLSDEYFDYFNDEVDSDSYVDHASDIVKVGEKYYRVDANAEIGKSHDSNDNDHYFIEDVSVIFKEIEATPEMKGSIELLWEVFGGKTNELGFKELDEHVGLIYGDSIDYATAISIFERLEVKGYASTNVVLGLGSYLYGGNVTRDSYGQAFKATYMEVNGIGRNIQKDPITDNGLKKSAKGLLVVIDVNGKPTLIEEQSWEEVMSDENMLKIRFKDGKFFNQVSFATVRERAAKANIFA